MPSRLAANFTVMSQIHLPQQSISTETCQSTSKLSSPSTNQPNQPNRSVPFNKTCQLNPNHGIAKMRPTPPSPPANETPPAQRNGHAHGDGSAIYPPPLTVAEPTYDGNGDLMDPDRHYVTDHLGYQYPWSPNRDSDGIRLIPGTPAWQANQQIEVNARNRVRSSGSGSGHTTSGNTAVATTERSSDENDSMSDTDETGDEYLSSANHSPGGTLPPRARSSNGSSNRELRHPSLVILPTGIHPILPTPSSPAQSPLFATPSQTTATPHP
jgi:hypothetical protein